ncbi:MAG: gluconokinase [Gammaproteobacteria bacterium]
MATVLVPMGVSGCGKSTLGKALAARLGWKYLEGDDFHSLANVAKMRAGTPLDDADRWPWLAAIAERMDMKIAAQESAVVACSALKRDYRDFLRNGRPEVLFIYLRVTRGELERRVAARHHAWMPASLLASQLATLEEPRADEPRGLTLNADGDAAATLEAVLKILHDTNIGN